jgi:DNA-binding NtrC family response regulator
MRDFGVLVVDDEEEARRRLAKALAGEFKTESAGSGEEALRKLAQTRYDLVLLDHKMPGLSGLDVLRRIKREQPQTMAIMVTAVSDLSLVVECMNSGAESFVVKPVDLEGLREKIRALAERQRLAAENRSLRTELDQRARFDDLVGESRPFTEMLAQVNQVAGLPIPVLIHGESGTGKELVARAVHRNSPRGGRVFLPVNCGAFPETLLASQLFGHVKGAFTDAREAKQGLFEAADGGTLFLDEIGESSAGVQVQLLRVLEAGEVLPVGATAPRKVSARVIAATNRDLEREVRERRFREDLYYRLWKFPIRVPPLRERPDDILPLAGHFLARYTREVNKRTQGFSREAMRLLERYHWPGNVRELQNAVERAVIITTEEELRPEHFLLGSRPQATGSGSGALFEEEWSEAKAGFERAYFLHRLREAGGNVSEAARSAGMDRRNFRDKLLAHGVSSSEQD